MSTLIIAEHNNQQLNSSTFHVCSAALALGKQPVILVVGHDCQNVAQQAAEIAGTHMVICVDKPELAHPIAEQIAPLVLAIADDYDAILAPATTFGKNLMPRVAAKLDMAQVSDVTRIIDATTFEHPIYAGNAIETVKVLEAKRLLTIRPTAFDAITEKQTPCCIEQTTPSVEACSTQFVSHALSKSSRPDLASAKIIVSGGRGLQNAEKFKLIEELADTLGAAIGASRAAVDAGFVSNDYQVGQTGKVVAPQLYIAIGISGAVQHLAGMKDSKTIVVINKDEDAPIFQIADYGIVGDLFELVPQLIAQLKS